MDGFEFRWSIALLETMGVVGGSFLERAHSGDVFKRVAPLWSYIMLSGLLGASSVLSNVALKYIEYPTKVCQHTKAPSHRVLVLLFWIQIHYVVLG